MKQWYCNEKLHVDAVTVEKPFNESCSAAPYSKCFLAKFIFYSRFSYSNNDVNAEILNTYTGSSDTLPALVLVNHDKVGPILAYIDVI